MKHLKNLLSFSLINIDKPTGPTSFSVSNYLRKELNLNKTSHMGTLDPKVTGVLPITLGRACKLASYFITHDKTYIGILQTHTEQEIKNLQELINKNFIGKIKQTPPHRSAVKREERERTVYSFEFLESSKDKKNFLFHCKVEGGTYIRKICSDLGDLIGGAHMGPLRRTGAGIFSEEKIYTLNELDIAIEELKSGNEKLLQEMLIPANEAIKKVLPHTNVDKRALKSLHTGKPLFQRDLIDKDFKIENQKSFALFCNSDFVGIYKKTSEKEIFARPEFVFD